MALTLHPLIIFFASQTALTVTAAYTPRRSPLRYATVVFLAVCAYIFPFYLTSFGQPTGWAGRIPAGAVFWSIVTCFDRLILREWDYDNYRFFENNSNDKTEYPLDQKTGRRLPQPKTRIEFGSEVGGLARGIGRFWEVKNVPLFSELRPEYVPSKLAFMCVQSIAMITCYYVHNMTVKVVLSVDHRYLSATQVPLLSRLSAVSIDEFYARVVVAAGYWVIQFSMLQCFYSAFGIIGVVSDPKSIEQWRPIFGSPYEAYTVRNFWGKTWHQNLRSGVEGMAKFFAHDILQLPYKGIVQRYTKILGSFFVSGFMHSFADAGGGLALSESGATQFFCMQALGIMIEDGVQTFYRQYVRRRSGPKAMLMERLIGYAWVFMFIVWTSPVWVFPATRNMRIEDDLLSFDAVKPILFGR